MHCAGAHDALLSRGCGQVRALPSRELALLAYRVHRHSFRGNAPEERTARRRTGKTGSIMADETYGEGRARSLEALLRALALRIQELDEQKALLGHAGELMRLIGDIRSELFHYEVRATYDTPEVAESRRIVSEAQDSKDSQETKWERTEWSPDEDEEREW